MNPESSSPEVSSWRRRLVQFGIPIVLAGGFVLVDRLAHLVAGVPWPDLTHLYVAALLLIGMFAILTVHQHALAGRAQARANLAAREASYRTLFDVFPEPTTVWSGNGVLLMQNLVSARNLGGNREDYLGKSILDVFGPETGPYYLERIQRVFRTGIAEEAEDDVTLPIGRRCFSTSMQRVRQANGEDAVQVISYDITERVEAEYAWRTEHERASTYLDVAAVMIVALDLEGRVTLINAKGCEILGRREADIIGRDWFEAVVPEGIRDKVRSDFRRLVANDGEADAAYENPLLTAKGEARLIAWHDVVLRDEAGKPVGSLSSGEDITDRRRAEEALRASEALRIQERSALEERQRLARELHDSVSQALYGIALGVNTALTVLDRDREGAREALTYSIGLARAGLSEMRALIFELRPESLESEGLVAALSKQAEAVRARFEMPVNLEACEEPDLSLTVKEALYRIAAEALHNAVKHAHAHELGVSLTCDESCLTLTVQDDGLGFDPEALHPGHFGLKSMRERAASVGGTVHIVSAPDAGACVQVRVPFPPQGLLTTG